MDDKKENHCESYSIDSLKLIKGINFTVREIDIMACLLNARGTSRMASLLDISPRTVGNHIRNLMVKLGCNSREGIIDFIERGGKQSLLRTHYSNLSLERAFQDTLKAIGKLSSKVPSYSFISWKEQKNYRGLLEKLKAHLERAGLTIHLEIREKQTSLADLIDESKTGKHAIYMVSTALNDIDFSQKISRNDDATSPNTLFIFTEKLGLSEIPQVLGGIQCIDFSRPENYYFSFFEVLKTLFPHINLENKIKDFKNRYDLTHASVETKNSKQA